MVPQIGLNTPGSGEGLVAASGIRKSQVRFPEVEKKFFAVIRTVAFSGKNLLHSFNFAGTDYIK